MSPPLSDSDETDCGDFVGSDDDYDVDEKAEAVDSYSRTESSFYPVRIGQMIKRYQIEHKLGHGGFSTVWMARDMRDKGKTVALKIMVAGDTGEEELKMQDEIMGAVDDVSRLVLYKDTFTIPSLSVHKLKGPSSHRIFIFPILGPSLGSCLKKRSMSARMLAAKQLTIALKCLHDGGIVCRDLNSRNVMWGIETLDNYDRAAKYKLLGRPKKIDVTLDDGVHAELVAPVDVPESLLTEDVFLGDFGLAIKEGASVRNKIQSPLIYCAPERLHDVDPSSASDIWSFMCLFLELYLGMALFYGTGVITVMNHVVDILGPLPEEWKGTYSGPGAAPDSWYDQNRKPRRTLESKVLQSRPGTTQKELDLVLSIAAKGFCYLPEERITTTQLLQDESFNALLRMYGRGRS